MHVYILLRRIFNLGTKTIICSLLFPFLSFCVFPQKVATHHNYFIKNESERESLIRRVRACFYVAYKYE
jgi:hypothetical protein